MKQYIERKNKKCNSDEPDNRGVFTVLQIVLRKQVQFKIFIDRVIENFMGYQNIKLLFQEQEFFLIIYLKYPVHLFV